MVFVVDTNSGNDYRGPMMGNSSAAQSTWTWSENKVFEEALVMFPEEMVDRWQNIANWFPGKLPEEVRAHYEALVHDVLKIESGRVEMPRYTDDSTLWEPDSGQISFGSAGRNKHGGRKKVTPWTEEEHRLFLIGLDTYGGGDWRSISRNLVVTKTPTQLRSHAQKFFLRQSSKKKVWRRTSIHDITTTTDTQTIPPPSNFPTQGSSTGYQNLNHPM